MSEAKICVKLLIDKSKQQVVFAEAGKEFVDLLFHILSLPLGTIVGYLTEESMVGSIGSLYGGLGMLSSNYLQDGLDKDYLLHPNPPAGSAPFQPLFAINPASDDPSARKFNGYIGTYHCCRNHFHFSDVPGAKCPNCKQQMNQALKYVTPSDDEGRPSSSVEGYVKGLPTYMIADNLLVLPMSMTWIFMLLKMCSVHDIDQLEERVFYLDNNLAVALLKASLMSKNVLTDVFLGKRASGII